ncbi:MAG: glycerophosphodiester phosphodiesterase [Firmicutes bacterium]|nr:glycerophosphodiester phosphodiesterase [Bacillota bacterium]
MGIPDDFAIIGHRGAMGHAPENTLASFRKAIDMGATMLELDVHLTKDGELVVIHDHELARTTTGSGLVEDMTLTEVRSFDAGITMGANYQGERVPTLQEVMELIDAQTALNIEIKAGRQIYPGIVSRLLEVISHYGLGDRVVISSFHRAYLREVVQKAPKIEVALLYAEALPQVLDEAIQERWQGLHPWYRIIDRDLIDGARRRGLSVRAWTVNQLPEMVSLVKLGVNGICTNFPDMLKSVVTELGLR